MKKATLKRAISLPMMVLYGLGTTIGAGIYALIGELAGISGYLAPFAFLVSSILAGLTALSFAELASRYPKAAGTALYTLKGFSSKKLSTLVGLLVVLAGVVSAAALVNAFSGYLNQFIEIDRSLAIWLTIFILGCFAIWGIAQSVIMTAIMTSIGIGGLLLVIFVGHGALIALPDYWPQFIPSASFSSWGLVYAGILLAFYAFIGFEDMVSVAEEVKNVQRNLPLAILITLGITTLLYMTIMTIAVLSISPEILATSQAPLATLYQYHTGEEATLITFIGLFAIIDGALVQIILASRVLYGLSSNQQLPPFLSIIYPKTHTPIYATAIALFLVLFFALIGSLGTLAEITSFIMLIVFSLVNLSLWRIKTRQPTIAAPHGLNLPSWVALWAFMVSSGFVFYEIYNQLYE